MKAVRADALTTSAHRPSTIAAARAYVADESLTLREAGERFHVHPSNVLRAARRLEAESGSTKTNAPQRSCEANVRTNGNTHPEPRRKRRREC